MWTNRVVAIISRKNGSFSIGDGRPLNFSVVAELSPFSLLDAYVIKTNLGIRHTPHELLIIVIYPSSFICSFVLFSLCVDLLNSMTDAAAAWDQYYYRWL